MSDAELDSRLQALSVDLAIANAKLDPGGTTGRRARKVFRGVVLTAAGLLLAAQTGGLTLLLCVAGVVDMIDVFEEDAVAVELQVELRSDLEQYDELFRRIAAEKARRDWW